MGRGADEGPLPDFYYGIRANLSTSNFAPLMLAMVKALAISTGSDEPQNPDVAQILLLLRWIASDAVGLRAKLPPSSPINPTAVFESPPVYETWA